MFLAVCFVILWVLGKALKFLPSFLQTLNLLPIPLLLLLRLLFCLLVMEQQPLLEQGPQRPSCQQQQQSHPLQHQLNS